MGPISEERRLKIPEEGNKIYNFFKSIYFIFNKTQEKDSSLVKKIEKESLPGIHGQIQKARKGIIDLEIVGGKEKFIKKFEEYHKEKNYEVLEGKFLKYWNKDIDKDPSIIYFEENTE